MNWLLIVVLAILAFGAIYGARKGLLRLLYSLVAVVLLVALVGYATPYVSGYIQTHTNLGAVISERVAEKLQSAAENAVDEAAQNQAQNLEDAGIHLPEVLADAIFEKSVDATQGAIAQSGAYQQLGDQVAGMLLMVLSFVVALVLALIVVFIIGKITDLANKIPVVKGANRFFGFLAGILLGFVVVWLMFMLIGVMSGSHLGQLALADIRSNVFLSALYDDNFLIKIILQFLS